jgi:hypothetical protein
VLPGLAQNDSTAAEAVALRDYDPAYGGFGSIAPNAARVLQRRMSVAPRKRQLATKMRHVVKGHEPTLERIPVT